MKLYFQYKEGTGIVSSYSESAIEVNQLEQIELNVSQDELTKLKSNDYMPVIENRNLVLKETDRLIIKKEQEQKAEEKRLKIDALNKAKTLEEVKSITIDLLK